MKPIQRFLASALACLSFCACMPDVFFVHPMLVELPLRPSAWLGLDFEGYEVLWEDEAGEDRQAFVAEGETIVVRLRRGHRQTILAWPRCGALALRPAAALYPFDLAKPLSEIPGSAPDRIALSFRAGYGADVATCIERAGRDPWSYPLEKLSSIPDIEGRDPWTIPPWKAAQAIIDGKFRISMFAGSLVSYELPLGAPWWPESPFCLLEWRENGLTARLRKGIHVFYGSGEKLIVEIGENGTLEQRIGFAELGEFSPPGARNREGLAGGG